MKQATINDYWNNLHKVNKDAKGISCIEQHCTNQKLSFEPDGVTAVVGLNGSGKSCFFDFLLNPAYNRLNFFKHDVHFFDGVIVNLPGQVITACLLDPSAELRESKNQLLSFRSLWTDQFSSFKPEEISLLNYVLGTSYEDIAFQEIELDDSEKPHPLFAVVINGLKIDLFSLSLGEQLVLYIFWSLTRKYKLPGIYLIEEPESGLSPAAQKRLVDLLVYISSKKSKQIFLSTHSPFIVSRLGTNRVILMKKTNQFEWVNANQSN